MLNTYDKMKIHTIFTKYKPALIETIYNKNELAQMYITTFGYKPTENLRKQDIVKKISRKLKV